MINLHFLIGLTLFFSVAAKADDLPCDGNFLSAKMAPQYVALSKRAREAFKVFAANHRSTGGFSDATAELLTQLKSDFEAVEIQVGFVNFEAELLDEALDTISAILEHSGKVVTFENLRIKENELLDRSEIILENHLTDLSQPWLDEYYEFKKSRMILRSIHPKMVYAIDVIEERSNKIEFKFK